ncbi:MAG: hypothetical protein V4773_14920 [Verrucomicrobiota bacterium]
MKAGFILLVILTCGNAMGWACVVVQDVSAADLAEWPLPVSVEVEAVHAGGVQVGFHVTIRRNEEALKRGAFGKVSEISLCRYQAGDDPRRENPVATAKLFGPDGRASLVVGKAELEQLRVVVDCQDTPKFKPCAGGRLFYRVPQGEK